MTRNIFSALLLGAATAAGLSGAARSDDSNALAEFSSLKPDVAVELAQAALASCRARGYQVAVTVVDRFGLAQAVIRDRYAGAHTLATSQGKAWTAVSFRARTLDLDARIAAGELSQGLRSIPGALVLGGGVPVESAGSLVGGIGISGAPDPAVDEECAIAGIEAIADKLDF
jgi:uncharacterized protein GlcG (DUF336 family)